MDLFLPEAAISPPSQCSRHGQGRGTGHILLALTLLSVGCGGCTPLAGFGRTGGPPSAVTPVVGALPGQLHGLWRVSLCLGERHGWIHLQNVDTGEAHTVSRFMKGFGDYTDPHSGERTFPPVPTSGVYWDQDLRYADKVAVGRYRFASVLVQDPVVYDAGGRTAGYALIGNNCLHFTRDAWHFYSGEWYDLPALAAPVHLGLAVRRRHQDIPWDRRFDLLNIWTQNLCLPGGAWAEPARDGESVR